MSVFFRTAVGYQFIFKCFQGSCFATGITGIDYGQHLQITVAFAVYRQHLEMIGSIYRLQVVEFSDYSQYLQIMGNVYILQVVFTNYGQYLQIMGSLCRMHLWLFHYCSSKLGIWKCTETVFQDLIKHITADRPLYFVSVEPHCRQISEMCIECMNVGG